MVSLVGYRFTPTHEELVSYYLKMKRDDPAFDHPKIKEVDIYKHHPCELPGLSSIQSDEQVWYFYCILDRKYAKSERPSRTAKGGSWKKTGIDRLVKAKDSNKQIGIKKTLVFYNGSNTRKENKTCWTMHEYHEYPCKKNSRFKGEVVVCRIERKPDKNFESCSAVDEVQPSGSLVYDPGNNVAEDIPQVEPQLPQNLHLFSNYNNDVAYRNLMEVESHPLSNYHISHVTEDITQELESQPLPEQYISSSGEDHVAQYISRESESQLLPNQLVSPIIGDHVEKATMLQLESQSPLPNFHASSTTEDPLTNNNFSEMEPRLLPNQHMSSNFEDYVAKSMFFENESQLPATHHLSSNTENHAAKSFPSEVLPLVSAQRDELITVNGLDRNSFSTLQSPICPTPGSSHSSSFGNDLVDWLDHKSSSALQSLFHRPPGCLHCSSCSNNLPSVLDLNSFATPQFPIHPLPESSYSYSFSNDLINGLDNVSAVQSPVYPQPGSAYSGCFSNDSNLRTPQVVAEHEEDLANSHWSVQDDFSLGCTSPVFNLSEAVEGGYVGGDGSEAVIETVSEWPNEYFPMANGEYHFDTTFLKHS